VIGDAGERDTTGSTLLALKNELLKNPNSAVIFLGDNCYKKILGGIVNLEMKGFDKSKLAKKRMMSQINSLEGYKGAAYFVPGNHDWWNRISIKKGKKVLLREEQFVESALRIFPNLNNNAEETFLPKNGEPGPVTKEFGNKSIRIIFIDTYRLILEETRNKKKNEILDKFYAELKSELVEAELKNQKIILIAHHPIVAKGKHSQPMPFSQKISKRFANSNINYKPYKKIAGIIDSLIKPYSKLGVYFISGHEHSLEYMVKDGIHYIISGAGSKIDKVKFNDICIPNECLMWNQEGFFEIDFNENNESVFLFHDSGDKKGISSKCVQGCEN